MRDMRNLFQSATKGQRKRNRQQKVVVPVAMLVVAFLLAQAFWLNRNQHIFRPFAVQRIWCEHCGKTGLVKSEKEDSLLVGCPACFGVGYHAVRRFDEQDVICVVCGGIGRVEDKGGEWRYCRRCNGRGLMRQTTWFERLGGGQEEEEDSMILRRLPESMLEAPPAEPEEGINDVR